MIYVYAIVGIAAFAGLAVAIWSYLDTRRKSGGIR
jgi:hypothetical protein